MTDNKEFNSEELKAVSGGVVADDRLFQVGDLVNNKHRRNDI